MNTLYKKIDINTPIGQFLLAINSNDESNDFVNATNMYPNHIVNFDNFKVTEKSKEILRNISEMNIINEEVDIDFSNIKLPFVPNEEDILAVYDMYTLQDNENHRSIINFNYFYNPTITNFMKLCRIKQYILNNKIVFTDDFVFINVIIADMLRRIRFVINLYDDMLYTHMYYFDFDDEPIVDTITTQEDLDNILEIYGNELYDDSCESPTIEVTIAEDTGDYDNESKLGRKESRKLSKMSIIVEETEDSDIIDSDSESETDSESEPSVKKANNSKKSKSSAKMTFYNGDNVNQDEIETESEMSDEDQLSLKTYQPIKRSQPASRSSSKTKKIGRMTVYIDKILDEPESDEEPSSPILSRRNTIRPTSKKIGRMTVYNDKILDESDEPDSLVSSKKSSTRPTSKKIGRMTVYNDQILDEPEESEEPENLASSKKSSIRSQSASRSSSNNSTRPTSKKIGRMTVYNDQILDKPDESDEEPENLASSINNFINSLRNSIKSNISSSNDNDSDDIVNIPDSQPIPERYSSWYNYTYIDDEQPIEDANLLNLLWIIADNTELRKKMLKNKKFNEWKNKYRNDMTNIEFLIALLRKQIPLNTENVEGAYFFNNLDVIDFMNLYDDYEDNTFEAVEEIISRYGKYFDFESGMSYEDAYPMVLEWIVQNIN